MKTTFKGGIAAAMAVAMFATTFVPAGAFAMPMPTVDASQSSDVQQVQWRERRDRRGWYGGHRGYRYHRHGYRRHSDGWWYPLAAFGAGAIIGGAIANDGYAQPRYEGINPRHTEWCYARYRSYRDYDNTFQPNYGGRRQCYSPYY
jgi:hypothetical protein